MSNSNIFFSWLLTTLQSVRPKVLFFHKITFILIVATIFTINQSCNSGFSQGKQLYLDNCGNCHGASGEGLKSLYPPIANSDYLEENFQKLPCIITKGISKSLIVNGKQYTTPMLGIEHLNDVELANIVNYIAAEWYPKNSYISLKDINMIIGKCK